MFKIHEYASELAAAHNKRHLLRCIKGGTEAMRDAGEEFLTRQKSEVAGFDKELGRMYDPYQERLKRSNLINITSESVARMVSKIMRKPTLVSASYPKHQSKIDDELLYNVDGNGMQLHDLEVKMLTEGIWFGSSCVLTNINDEGRPVANFVHIDNILDAFFDDDTNELIFLRIREIKKDMDFSSMEITERKREKVYKKEDGRVMWARFEEVDKGDKDPVIIDDWQVTPFARIPLSVFKAGEEVDGNPILCRSAVQNLAELTARHWNKDSDLENIYHISCCPMLFGSGMGTKKDMNYTVSRMIMNSNVGADIKWIEPEGSAIKLAQESLDRLETKMESMGFSYVASGHQETATGRSLKASESHSTLGGIARALQMTLEDMFENMLSVYLFGKDPEVTAQVNQEFGVTISTDELNALSAAYTGGALSRHFYLKELMRRGVLDESTDPEQNNLRLLEERDLPLVS